MRLLTEPLRRNTVTIGPSLLLALGMAYYVLGCRRGRRACVPVTSKWSSASA